MPPPLPSASSPPSAPGSFSTLGLLRHGLITLMFCCVLAMGLAVSKQEPWDNQLVYSLGIGMTIWLIVDIGRHLLKHEPGAPWPSGLRGIALVAFAIASGFFVGTWLGDLYCGCSIWASYERSPKGIWSPILITVASGVVGCYYFYSRGKSQFLQSSMLVARRDAAEARLKLLETQLEPHMLFNTLANLRALIGSDPQRAEVMLDHMIAYLRATLGASLASTHSLQAEFDRLRDYLELMAVRMGPRLSYTLDLPPELAQHTVPTLLLQPLVENSIKHGLEPKIDGGSITVSARHDGAFLVLDVTDTGVGLATAPAGTGFGTAQVRERLASTYGPDSAIELVATPSGGTRATARIPLKP